MSRDACVLLHPDALRPRHVGDVVATYCDACDALWFPQPPEPAVAPDAAPLPFDPRGWAPGELVEAFGR